MRPYLPAAALAATLLATPAAQPPAHAVDGIVLTCTVSYNGGSGTADCTAWGTVSGTVHMEFSDQPNCPGATAEGTSTGALAVSFVWTRIGSTGWMSTTGQVNGGGVIEFSQPCQPIVGPETMVVELVGNI